MLGILLIVRYVISWEEIIHSRILEWIERWVGSLRKTENQGGAF